MRHIPRILNCAAVKRFAVLDGACERSSTGVYHQAGQGPDDITQLAICQQNDGSGFALYYCNDDWKTLRSRYFANLDEAVRHANAEYPFVSVRWLTPQEAARRHAEYTRDPRCAFCGKLFPGYEKLIAGDGACICHDCIDYYHECYVIRPHVRENTPTRRTAS